MDTSDVISVVGAGVSLVGVAVSGYFAVRAGRSSAQANASAEESNRIADGQAETAMRDGITAARQRVEDLYFRAEEFALMPVPEDDAAKDALRKRKDRVLAVVRAAIEEYLNRYDMACGQYLSGNVADEARFEEAYSGEVRSLCETEKHFFKERMQPEEESPYRQLWAVYWQWFPDGREA